MSTTFIIAFLGIGLLAGFLSGLLGMGGGVIFVPFQVLLFSLMGVPQELQMKLAVGTSLAAIMFSTLSATIAQQGKQSIWWEMIYKMLTGLILGALVGAYLTRIMPAKMLEIAFGIFAILLGIHFFLLKALHEHDLHKMPDFSIINALSISIGTLSSMLGIGGGTIAMPILVYLKVPLRKAIGSAVAISCLLSTVGSIVFLLPALRDAPIYPNSLGFLFLPSFIPMSLGAAIIAPFGVKMSHYLPKEVLKKIFAIVLCIIGIGMILR